MTGKTISQRVAEREARKKTLQLRPSKKERAIDTRHKVPIGTLPLHQLENGDQASSSRPFLEWLQWELSKYPVRGRPGIVRLSPKARRRRPVHER